MHQKKYTLLPEIPSPVEMEVVVPQGVDVARQERGDHEIDVQHAAVAVLDRVAVLAQAVAQWHAQLLTAYDISTEY